MTELVAVAGRELKPTVEDVLAVTAAFAAGEAWEELTGPNGPVRSLRKLLWTFWRGHKPFLAKRVEKLFGDPEKSFRRGKSDPVSAHVWCTWWVEALRGIPQRVDLGFDVPAQQLALLCVFEEMRPGPAGRVLHMPERTAWDLLHRRSRNKIWQHGRPGVADLLMAVHRKINGPATAGDLPMFGGIGGE